MEKVNFGVTKRGEEASLYVLENKNNTTIKVTDYGATLVSLLFADKAGVQKDLVLGYDNVTGYEEHISYFGAIIGRNGNRIKDSRFTINGKSTGLTRMRIIIISTVEKTGLTRSSGK